MRNKKTITIITIIAAAILIIFGLTGCNYQMVDLNYSYDKAICKIGNETKEIEIRKWTDYDGEQLQIIDKEGNVYLVSSLNCTLIKED
jgi:radical SAM superfamily enzyme with C-terminal helix-hairpin-helix motif